MGSLDRWIQRLEELYASSAGEPADKAKEAEREIMAAILYEIGYLGACRANSHYRGGTPPTRPATLWAIRTPTARRPSSPSGGR